MYDGHLASGAVKTSGVGLGLSQTDRRQKGNFKTLRTCIAETKYEAEERGAQGDENVARQTH